MAFMAAVAGVAVRPEAVAGVAGIVAVAVALVAVGEEALFCEEETNICCMAGSIWAITAAMISSVVATSPSLLSDADAMIAIDIPPIQYSLGAMTC